MLREAGAELVFFSPLVDSLPEGVAGLYFGGGCPERYAEELASNRQLMAAVHAFAEAGGVIYAEYAGLIYLSQSVQPIGSLPCSMGAPQSSLCLLITTRRPGKLWQHGRVCHLTLMFPNVLMFFNV